MIIESGQDLRELLFADWNVGHGDDASLRIVVFDESLRLIARIRGSAEFRGDLDDHIDDFEVAIAHDDARYVSAGHRVSNFRPGGVHDYSGAPKVMALLDARDITFLGELIHDDEWWASSGPMHEFASYVMEHLPRALVIPGPHPFLDCECAACVARRSVVR